MGHAASVISIIGGVFALLVIIGGLYAVFTLARKDAIQKRQAGWIVEMTARLDYVEPKMEKAVAENKLLRQLANPTSMMENNHREIMRVLNEQSETLSDVVTKLENR